MKVGFDRTGDGPAGRPAAEPGAQDAAGGEFRSEVDSAEGPAPEPAARPAEPPAEVEADRPAESVDTSLPPLAAGDWPEAEDPAPGADPLVDLLEGWSGVSAGLGKAVGMPDAEAAEAGEAPAVTTIRVAVPSAAEDTEAPGAATAPTEEAATGEAEAATRFDRLPDRAAAPDEPVPAAQRRADSAPAASVEAQPGLRAIDAEAPAPRSEVLAVPASASADPMRAAALQADWRPAAAHPQSVMRQIADAVVTMREDRIEIALSPEELGRVRMILSGTERAPQVTFWIERPEVMDMIRRNTTLLEQHFGEAGFEGAGFEFREDRGSRDTAPNSPRPGGDDDPTGLQILTAGQMVSPMAGMSSGLRHIDLRL
ncbi:flagellar hook-length control protein FliK [Paracoccus sp. XHP0099]|uniref:Flagellar hook-length control protein FliK n=2 Tax=Paracoccus marinaquae TaxID=2841926 RepID=A0ABS6AF11_9RHOB|nr:flagellar hook-length control protein FliK [Paracoccus marinaquae]